MMEGYLEFGCAVHLDFQRLVIEVKIGPFGHNIERIQELTHRRSSHPLVLRLTLCS